MGSEATISFILFETKNNSMLHVIQLNTLNTKKRIVGVEKKWAPAQRKVLVFWWERVNKKQTNKRETQRGKMAFNCLVRFRNPYILQCVSACACVHFIYTNWQMAFARRTFVACVEHSPVLFDSFLLVLAILISIRRWPVFLEQQQLFNKYFRAFSVALFVLLYATFYKRIERK